jgi:nicotinamide mononucleotide (NMN) deamidase PncC
MARGARRLFGAAWALGETGVAGPQTGRRSAKPAGLTFLAVVGERDGQPVERVKRHLLPTPGDRVATKRAFAEAALALLRDELQT